MVSLSEITKIKPRSQNTILVHLRVLVKISNKYHNIYCFYIIIRECPPPGQGWPIESILFNTTISSDKSSYLMTSVTIPSKLYMTAINNDWHLWALFSVLSTITPSFPPWVCYFLSSFGWKNINASCLAIIYIFPMNRFWYWKLDKTIKIIIIKDKKLDIWSLMTYKPWNKLKEKV